MFLDLTSWLSAHWLELGVALGYLIAAARVIVKLTPTPADDSRLERVIRILKHLGLHLE